MKRAAPRPSFDDRLRAVERDLATSVLADPASTPDEIAAARRALLARSGVEDFARLDDLELRTLRKLLRRLRGEVDSSTMIDAHCRCCKELGAGRVVSVAGFAPDEVEMIKLAIAQVRVTLGKETQHGARKQLDAGPELGEGHRDEHPSEAVDTSRAAE